MTTSAPNWVGVLGPRRSAARILQSMSATVDPAEFPPAALRHAYLSGLYEPQELHVELMVASGQTYLVGNADRPVGYAVVNSGVVVEFFLSADHLPTMPAMFQAVLDTTGARRAVCKTFDPSMLTAAASRPATISTTGFLFRRVDKSLALKHGVHARLATRDDVDSVLRMHDGFFTDRDEIERYVRNSYLFVYESSIGDLLGCGILTRVIDGLDGIDVGMVVAAEHRRRGLGVHILSDLKRRCLDAGLRPIAGCRADNVASRRSLERAGFTSAHSLVEFRYG